jgi:hypothetical protein
MVSRCHRRRDRKCLDFARAYRHKNFQNWAISPIEARQAIGYDAFMSSWTNVMTGVALHTGSESGGNTTCLLDMTPESSSWYDPALTSSRTFTDSDAGLTLTTVTAGPSGATLSVTLSPATPACAPAAPQVTVSPSTTAAVTAGTTVSYTVTVTNNDSSACNSSTFSLAAPVPAGWAAGLDASSLSLLPGTSGSTTLRVTSSSTAASGAYSLQVSASDPNVAGHSAGASASYSVAAAASLQATTDKASYTRSETVNVTARLLAGTSPVRGASVSIVIRKANGATVSGSATDANGYAVYRLRLKVKDPLGSWQATASASGATSTASFSVR